MGCYCHLNPPCSYCMEKEECLSCGEPVHPDESHSLDMADEAPIEPFCKSCFDKILEGGF